MLHRVTEQSMLNSSVSSIQRNFKSMEASQRRLSTGRRIQSPHENVTGTVNSIYHRTRINMINQYQANIGDAKGRIDVAHGAFDAMNDVLHKARGLAVQGANSTYNHEDRVAMAMEIEQLVRRTHEISNTKYKDEYIFGGDDVKRQPFRLSYSQDDLMGRKVVSEVVYEGDDGQARREVGDNNYIETGIPGHKAFWAQNSEMLAAKDASMYMADRDQTFMIDDTKISISAGDTIEVIADKINGSGGNVKAAVTKKFDGSRVLQLRTREPHRIMLRDLEGGSVLQDIGLVREGMPNDPQANYHPGVDSAGNSTFEVLMQLRDNLLNDDVKQLGSTTLGLIDEALSNTVHNQAKLSATAERLDLMDAQYSKELTSVEEALSKVEDVDYAEEMVEFKMWEYVHTASLQTSAKLLKPTLMDYLR